MVLRRMHELLEEASPSRKDFEGMIYGTLVDLGRVVEDMTSAGRKGVENAVPHLNHFARTTSDLVSLFSALKPSRDAALKAIKILKGTAPTADRQVVEDRTVSRLEEEFETAMKLIQTLPSLVSRAKYKRAREVVGEIEDEMKKAKAAIDREEKTARGF